MSQRHRGARPARRGGERRGAERGEGGKVGRVARASACVRAVHACASACVRECVCVWKVTQTNFWRDPWRGSGSSSYGASGGGAAAAAAAATDLRADAPAALALLHAPAAPSRRRLRGTRARQRAAACIAAGPRRARLRGPAPRRSPGRRRPSAPRRAAAPPPASEAEPTWWKAPTSLVGLPRGYPALKQRARRVCFPVLPGGRRPGIKEEAATLCPAPPRETA